MLGGAAHPKWELLYPYYTLDQRTKVMAYVRIHSRGHAFKKNAIRATPCNNLVAHPSLQIVDLRVGGETWQIVNFYNDTKDASALRALLNLDLDPLIPTLVVGDFNLHSPRWSPPGFNRNPTTDRVEDWAGGSV
jgi:hypothetical protein